MPIPKRLPQAGEQPESSHEETEATPLDETFQTASLDDQLAAELEDDDNDSWFPDTHGDDSEETESVVETPEPEKAKDETPAPVKRSSDSPKKSSNKKSSSGKKKKQTRNQSVEIDGDKKKLMPFGSKKKVLRVGDFDPRKDLRRNQKLTRFAVIGIFLIIMSIGFYQAVFPAKPLTEQEVYNLSLEATNYTNFPVESGRGFATDFMDAYLTVDPDSASADVLNYYYSGSLESASGSGSSSTSTRTATGSYNQTILSGPTVYSARGLTDTSGAYTVGALVQPQTIANDGDGEAQVGEPKWMFFNVNVYFNEASRSFAITPESPSVIPATEVMSQQDIPNSAPLGTGDASDELGEDVSSVVNGFMEGYSTTTPTDHSVLDQYIVSDPEPALTKGLSSEYTLDDSSNALSYEAFPSDEEDSNEVKVRVTATWVSSPDGSVENESRVQFTSTYIMTLERQGDGRYLVSKFAPEYYVADPTDGE